MILIKTNINNMANLDKFREETKEWLDKNCPPSMRSGADPKIPVDEVWGGRNAEYKNPESKLWLDRMGAKGWTMPTVPKEYGGGGLSKDEVKVLNEELFRIGAKQPLLSFGIWMLAPVLLEYGSEEQKKEHIPKIIKGEIRWCQGYSEPGSGSDLASLATKAEDIGEKFLVNGQKVWTSYADKADWIFALVRTGPKEPKHDGISFLLINMGSKRDIVSIAKKHLGEENGKINNGFYRSEISSHKIKEHAFGLTLKRAGDEGGKASATASMFKLYGTEHNKKRHELMVAASGINGVAWDGDEFDDNDKNLTRAWLRTKGNSIEGGTSEVQLNVISKRVLGLPSQ